MIKRLCPVILVAMIPILMMCGSSELPLTYNSIHGSGDLVSVLLDVESFHSVNLTTVAEDVNLLFGTEQSLEVTVDHNLLKFITTEVTPEVSNIISVSDQGLPTTSTRRATW